jgi:hypothetical protein
MEPIDIDSLFEAYLKKYMKENAGKYTEEQWEEKMSELYKYFGNTPLNKLGVSPTDYYNTMTGEELKDLLKIHVEKGISVPDFLCDAIVNKKCEDDIITLLNTDNEELKAYAVNLLNDMGSTKPLSSYFDLLKDSDVNADLKELATEILTDNCNNDLVKERAIEEYSKYPEIKVFLIEVLARCKKDERIYKILIDEFINNPDNIPLYTSYLSIYGDERALPYLLTEIEREGISFVDFQELKFGIEALGGEYEKERNFKNDIYYKKIKEENSEN